MRKITIIPSDIQIDKIFKPKYGPTFLATIFLILAWFANELALAWAHDRIPRDDVSPLPDLWFSLFPEITNSIIITELIMIIVLMMSFIVMFCHQYRWIIIRRVPVPSRKTYCAPKSNGNINIIITRILTTFWSAGIEQLRSRELCGDLIISGHTISLFMATLILKQYCPKKFYYLAKLSYRATFIAVPCILLARKHYTIDVVLAYCLTTRIFWTYHSLSNSYHQGEFDQIPLNQSFWAFMIPYLEADAPPPQYFQNLWNWPSSCLQHFRKRRP
ncbi:Sphingomyelin synthase-related 2 [Dirofilaria immitis]|nr:Sphingomyelin synthase-related 2 [Dirofilaria immitis]